MQTPKTIHIRKTSNRDETYAVDSSKVFICSARKKSDHCLTHCFHGIPHIPDTGKDSCKITHICTCSNAKGIPKFKCKKLTKKQILEFTNEET